MRAVYTPLRRHSGRTAYGGYIGGTLAAIVATRLLKVPFWRFADAVAPTLALGLGVVRIGCFCFGCDYGFQTDEWGVVFPEGSRNPSGPMGAFKSGLFHLAKKRPDLELMPVYIDNLNRVMPKGEFLPVPLLSCISIGCPMWLESGESKNDFLDRARNEIVKLRDI